MRNLYPEHRRGKGGGERAGEKEVKQGEEKKGREERVETTFPCAKIFYTLCTLPRSSDGAD